MDYFLRILDKKNSGYWLCLSGKITIFLLLVLIGMWMLKSYENMTDSYISRVYNIFPVKCKKDESVYSCRRNYYEYLEEKLGMNIISLDLDENVIYYREGIKTGIFLESLNIESSNEIHISGFVWQEKKYKNGKKNKKNFMFPDEVRTGSYREPEPIEVSKSNKSIWKFESILKQPFLYKTYPFDSKLVSVQIWNDYIGTYQLEPDLESGKQTYDKDIVVSGFDIKESFFSYKTIKYDTDFGLSKSDYLEYYPTLHYNMVLRRQLIGPILSDIVPLGVVAGLLFGILNISTPHKDRASFVGFNTSGVLGVCSGLFFLVLLSHIGLRERVSGFTYIEYLYIIMYFFILFTSINAHLVTIENTPVIEKMIKYENNLIPDILFGPSLLISINFITFIILFDVKDAFMVFYQPKSQALSYVFP